MGHARQIREKIALLEKELALAKRTLAIQVANCAHRWGETEYTPLVREAYSTGNHQGNHPGRPEILVHVPRAVTPKWTRTCIECGKPETTTNTTKKVSETPRF